MSNIIKIGSLSVMGFMLVACATSNVTEESVSVAKSELASQTKDVTEWKTATVTVSDGTKKVCKRTQQTGTRFKKKVCLTQEQWDEMAEASKRENASNQRRGAQQANPTGG